MSDGQVARYNDDINKLQESNDARVKVEKRLEQMRLVNRAVPVYRTSVRYHIGPSNTYPL